MCGWSVISISGFTAAAELVHVAIEVTFLRLVESFLNITFAWGESSQYTQCTTVALNCRCLFLPATHNFFFPAALHIMMMCISLPCWQTMWKEHGSQIALNLAEEGNTFCSTHEFNIGGSLTLFVHASLEVSSIPCSVKLLRKTSKWFTVYVLKKKLNPASWPACILVRPKLFFS